MDRKRRKEWLYEAYFPSKSSIRFVCKSFTLCTKLGELHTMTGKENTTHESLFSIKICRLPDYLYRQTAVRCKRDSVSIQCAPCTDKMMMCPVTMPLTYIQSNWMLNVLFVVLVALLSMCLCLCVCVFEREIEHECVRARGNCIQIAYKLHFSLARAACLANLLAVHGIHSDGYIVASMVFLHCSELLIFHIQSWAELWLGEMQMNDLFKWPRPASHTVWHRCIRPRALSQMAQTETLFTQKIDQIVNMDATIIRTR